MGQRLIMSLSDGQTLSPPQHTDLIRMYLLSNKLCIDKVNTNKDVDI
jgi:hypothetical protein